MAVTSVTHARADTHVIGGGAVVKDVSKTPRIYRLYAIRGDACHDMRYKTLFLPYEANVCD